MYNKKYFGGRLPAPGNKVRFADIEGLGLNGTRRNRYRTVDGRTSPCELVGVYISRRFKDTGPVSLTTLLHEMSHVATWDEKVDHGPRFYKEIRRLMKLGAFDKLV
jgi:hypothetical protein